MTFRSVLDALRRTALELTLFAAVAALLFYVPISLESQGLQLLLYKVLLFSGSQLHAMVVRKWFFPYIDFGRASGAAPYMVIALHVASAYVYAQGG